MQLNKVHTVDRVAAELGETIDRLHDLAIGMDPEDGVIWVYGTAEIETLAFTPFGIENLVEMTAMQRGRQPRAATGSTGGIRLKRRCNGIGDGRPTPRRGR